jgi:hypothetical protein
MEETIAAPPAIIETSNINAVRTVLGMSILVLGFFLLMLGINLRQEAPTLNTPA